MVVTKKYLERLILEIKLRLSLNKSVIEMLEIEMMGTWVDTILETNSCMNNQEHHQILIKTFLRRVKNEHVIIG